MRLGDWNGTGVIYLKLLLEYCYGLIQSSPQKSKPTQGIANCQFSRTIIRKNPKTKENKGILKIPPRLAAG